MLNPHVISPQQQKTPGSTQNQAQNHLNKTADYWKSLDNIFLIFKCLVLPTVEFDSDSSLKD